MKLLSLTTILLLMSVQLFTQDSTGKVKVGVHAGTILTKYVSGKRSTSFGGLAGGGQFQVQYYDKYIPAAFAGISLWKHIIGKFGFHLEADYTRLHQRITYTESSIGMAGSSKDSTDITYKATSLMIPAGIVVGDRHIGFTWGLYLNIPLRCNVLAGTQYIYASTPQYSIDTVYLNDQINWMPKTDFGTYLAFNAHIRVKKKISLTLATRYGRGFKLIDSPNYQSRFFVVNMGIVTLL